ncbi:MAG: oligosaccharide flippase family protein [Bacteroidales bacterium]|jgi:O-antigen/teichoic acid export membrane protein
MSAHPLKILAGETAIYGLSTILARVVNFLFIPIYTRILSTSSYGTYTEFSAYIAILLVLLTLGLETGCFRFANTHNSPKAVFSNALLTVTIFSVLAFTVLTLFAEPISTFMDYKGYPEVIVYIGSILAIDSFTAILFAKLRFERKAVKFAVLKTIKIFSETAFNLILFFIVPAYLLSHPQTLLLSFISATPDFTYILFATFLSGVVSLIIFIPDILKVRFAFNKQLWKMMMIYSLPLMVAQLPGALNDSIDRLLFRFFSPEGNIWRSDLGIFQAGVKIATLMMLCVQMFRFAAEPFFFSRAKEEGSKDLYASIMEHFTAFSMLVFLGIMLYMDLLEYVVGSDFRKGIDIVPVMLMAYVILGMNFNVSMWYKLSGKTNIAIYITLAGLLATLAINIGFMPLYSYHAAAWGHFVSYSIMLILSVILGNKYYHIPYKWKKILGFVALGLAIYAVSLLLPEMNLVLKLGIHTILIFIYITAYLHIEKISLWKLKF